MVVMVSQGRGLSRSASEILRNSLMEGMAIWEETPLSWVEEPSGRYHFWTVSLVPPILVFWV